MFGGRVRPGIDHRWCSHASIPKTALQLFGLPALGVARVDNDPGLADLIDLSPHPPSFAPAPPASGTTITQPPTPQPAPAPSPPPPRRHPCHRQSGRCSSPTPPPCLPPTSDRS